MIKKYKLVIISSIFGFVVDGSFKYSGMISYMGDFNTKNNHFISSIWPKFKSTGGADLFIEIFD